jgi:putative membrane protein
MAAHTLLSAAGIAAFGLSIVAAAAPGEGDQQFLARAIQSDIAEVKLAELALQRSNDDGVRELAHRLQTDHTSSMQEATTLARMLSVMIPSAPTEDAQRHYETLARLSGAAFDEAFVEHMVEGHREAVRDFRERAEANDDSANAGAVAGLAKKSLPTLEQHLAIAEELHVAAADPAGPHAGAEAAGHAAQQHPALRATNAP